jgi:hypothetical protein
MPNHSNQKPASVQTVTQEEILASIAGAPTAESEIGVTEEKFQANGKTFYKIKMADGTEIASPKPIGDMTLEDFERLPGAMSVDNNKLPQELSVKFKEPHWAGHWFNCMAGEGKRVHMVARSLGFVPAKIEDLEWYSAGLNDGDGALRNGDLVLFKIHKMKLLQRQASAMNQARSYQDPKKYLTMAQSGMPENKGKAEIYFRPEANNEPQGLGAVDAPRLYR